MRLIDADALWDKVLEHAKDGDVIYSIPPDFIDKAPTVDAEPVRHGRWIDMENKRDSVCKIVEYGKGYGMCSECQNIEWLYKGKKFCPNCGAKMMEV